MAGVVLSVLAHPDDAEFLCAGVLIRLVREHGWQAHVATLTPGDCGSADRSAEEIGAVRRREGADAAALIGATYHCLEERDLLVFYNGQPGKGDTPVAYGSAGRRTDAQSGRLHARP